MNIGPRADGTIPDEVQRTLLDVGGWLKVNGAAIYGTRPWTVYGEGPTKVAAGAFLDTAGQPYTSEDFRFTQKDGVLYAIELGWPSNHEAVIHSLGPSALGNGKQIQSVQLLGSAGTLPFEEHADGLHVHLPEQPVGKYAYAIRIELLNRR